MLQIIKQNDTGRGCNNTHNTGGGGNSIVQSSTRYIECVRGRGL